MVVVVIGSATMEHSSGGVWADCAVVVVEHSSSSSSYRVSNEGAE